MTQYRIKAEFCLIVPSSNVDVAPHAALQVFGLTVTDLRCIHVYVSCPASSWFFGSHLIRLRSGSGVSRIWEGFSVPSHRSAYAARASATRLFGWVRPHLQSLSLAARLPDEGCVVHRDQPRQALGTDSTADYDLRSRQALTLSRMLTYKYVDGPALSGTNSANTNASTSPQIQAQDKGSSETPTSSPNTATQQTQLELLATVATSNEIW